MDTKEQVKDKYYVPGLEEFHVGFEYEFKERFQDGSVKTQEDFDNAKWINQTIKVGDLPYIERTLKGKTALNKICGIRVKYLDQEDIESLGWNGIDKLYIKYQYRLLISYNYNIKIYNEFLKENIFNGVIKNKSQLKKLMKQLNIE